MECARKRAQTAIVVMERLENCPYGKKAVIWSEQKRSGPGVWLKFVCCWPFSVKWKKKYIYVINLN
jgi:hypothetical protein